MDLSLEDCSDSDIDEVLLDRPVSSIRDLQYVYGSLYSLARWGPDWREWATTPEQYDELDESDSVVAVDFAETEDGLEYDGLHVEAYDGSLSSDLMLSVDSSSGNIIHFGVTQISTGKKPEGMNTALKRVIKRWPDKLVNTLDFHEEHPKGRFLELMDEVDNSLIEESHDDLQTELPDEKKNLVFTARIKPEDEDTYLWPGDDWFDGLFTESMVAFKSYKMAKRNGTVSEGDGFGYVSGDEGRVVGRCPKPVFDMFPTKQTELFPGMAAENSWQAYPVSVKTAFAIDNSEPVFDELAVSHPGTSTTFYYLPYFDGVMDVTDARDLVGFLEEVLNRSNMAAIEYLSDRVTNRDELLEIDEIESEKPLRVRFIESSYVGNFEKLFSEADTSLHSVAEVSNSLRDVVRRVSDRYPPYSTDSGAHPSNHDTDWDERIYTTSEAQFKTLLSGQVLSQTARVTNNDEEDDRWDELSGVHRDIIAGDGAANARMLIQGFVDRLHDVEVGSFGLTTVVMRQYAVLSALAATNNLESQTDTYTGVTEPPEYMVDEDKSLPADLTDVESFIDEHPYLRENYEARGVFATGALTGHLSRIQHAKNKERQMIDQHPVDAIRPASFERRARQIMQKNFMYTTEEEASAHPNFNDIGSIITDSLSRKSISDWDIDSNQMQFFYALGVQYGWGHPGRGDNDENQTDE